ncbi:hypothetical protein GCM10009807_28660 [Microbacterium lacus]|uniref:Uncharacterized protein n=1 Tax=Microbacterium lacus TaxID=415217 RepID=A0ABN2H7J3_9MICO
MPKQHRERTRTVAIDDREIRVTEPRRFDSHKDLAATRRIEIDLGELQRHRLAVGSGRAFGMQNCSSDSHSAGTTSLTRRSSDECADSAGMSGHSVR